MPCDLGIASITRCSSTKHPAYFIVEHLLIL